MFQNAFTAESDGERILTKLRAIK